MLKKILSVTGKIIVGLFLFYLLAGFVLVPLALWWGIPSQGTKLLKHPVQVQSVYFNPFLWRLDISGLRILDADHQVLVGFDKFTADASFLSLFGKAYRVESLRLDGLKVNAVLLPGNKINLLELVPAAEVAPATGNKPAAGGTVTSPSGEPVATAQGVPARPLPVLVVDEIVLSRGSVHFTDQTISPKFSTVLDQIEVRVTGLSTRPDCQARVDFQAVLDGKGAVKNELMVRPFVVPLELETTFSLDGYAMTVLTPYIGKYTGRALQDGRLEFNMTYRIAGNRLTASHKVLIQRFEFGGKVPSKDALPLPFGLAVALLEDPQGRININLPVTGDLSKPDFRYWPLVGQVVRNFFMGLVTKPFAFLASALGADSGTDELGYVRFQPGQSVLLDAEKEKLKTLIKGLAEHPRLMLEVNGGYDDTLDWKAIKTDVLERDFKELRKDSTRPDSALYQMLYQRRFGLRDLWDITKKFKVKEGEYKDADLVTELKRRLIEEGAADRKALEALAQERAKAIYEQLLADGMDRGRIRLGTARPSQASMGLVPSEFTLTVFGQEEETAKSEQPVPAGQSAAASK
ncbi:MAG: DUF748 domain-containing protein [Candidatus Omnitrophica bacterium]|nr:DUF748 domain-containing protein [Candidatus Omnitrophota bacterium]